MSRRYWLPLCAIVGLILTSQVQAQGVRNDARGQPGATRSSAKPKADTPPAIPIAVQNDIHGIAAALDAANKKQPSDTEKDQARRNLDAQEKMASWVPLMFGVGIVETLLTLTGVILVWRTLKASWAAQKEAKRAADAAHATVASMEDTAKRQLRAYIGAKVVKHGTIGDDSRWRLDDPPVVHIELRNFGQTPAHNVRSWVRMDLIDYPSPEVLDEPVPLTAAGRVMQPTTTFTVAVGDEMSLPREIVTAIESDTNPVRLYVWGETNYEDIFGETHTTKFRLMYGGSGIIRRGKFHWAEAGNDAD